MNFKTVLSFACLVFSLVLFGQILKVDKGHLTSDSSGYTVGSSGFSVSLNNRSSSLEEEILFIGARAGFDLVRVREKSATVWIGTINYTKLGDGPFISNGTGHLRQVFLRKRRVSPESYVQFQYDRSRRMQLRRLLGAGLRWKVLPQKDAMRLGLGLMNEFEEWRTNSSLVTKSIWKMNSYIGGEVGLAKNIILNTIVYFQTGMDTESDVLRSRASGHLEVKTRLTDHLEAKVITEFAWDKRPIIPLNQWIYEMYFGLEYDF